MYAIIQDSGKQFMVTSGERIEIDRKLGDDEKTIRFDQVLLVGGEGETKVGQPLVAGASVEAEVLGAIKGDKVVIYKYRRRKGYHKKQGHRQKYTEVLIKAINV